MSRAGSMWTYNVARHLLRAGGYQPLPENIPVDDQVAIQETMKRGPGKNGVFCFKTHKRVEPITPEMRVISPYRDVRDAMYSFMKFMKCPFERALMAAGGMMENADYYLQSKADNVMPLHYERIVNHPEQTVFDIAGFLNLEVTDTEVKEIAVKLSRKKIKKYLDGLDDIKIDDEGTVKSEAREGRYAVLPRFDGSHRLYDHTTGFQSNHITTGKEGEWRRKLSRKQKIALNELTGFWLKKYNFPV